MAGAPKRRSDLQKIETEVGEEGVLGLIEQGYTLRRCASELGVSLGTMSKWVSATPERTAAVSRARARGAGLLAEQTLDIADESGDARLRVDTRKWLASKWNAIEYGEQRPSLTVNIATAHLSDLRGLLVAAEQVPQALDISDAKVLEAPSKDGKVR